MPHFLYITEVFCPWCYGFSPVIQRIQKEYTLPFKVICGALMEEPVSLATRFERMPNTVAFIERMHSITQVRISDAYLKLLTSPNNAEIFMDSQKGGLLFYTLKHFLPEKSLQIMEDLQDMFYGQGLDIFSKKNITMLIQKYALDLKTVYSFMENLENKEKSFHETEESFDIMGDIVLYPTLYYVNNDGSKYFISRGYMPYDECKKKIEDALSLDKQGILPNILPSIVQDTLQDNTENMFDENKKATFCTLDGKCT